MFHLLRDSRRLLVPLAFAAVAAWSMPVWATLPPDPPEGNIPPGYVPEVVKRAREAAGVDEKLNAQLPMDLELIDSTGEKVRLGDYFEGERPVIVQMAYYRCPQLCGEITQGMIRSMRALAEELAISEDFEVLTISFDSRERPALAASNKNATIDVLKRSWTEQQVRQGWQFMVAEDPSIVKLTEAMGYRFGWIDEAQQYSHPAAVVICTPDGRISRYLYGVGPDPQTLRLSLLNASQGTITPSLKDVFMMSCFAYDPQTGKYTPVARKIMQLGGIVTVLTLVSVVTFMLVLERRGKLKRHPMAGTPASQDDPPDQDGPPPPRTAFSG